MAVQIIDSPLHCPRDGKRLAMSIGQDDSTGAGDMRASHDCWSCGYSEPDKAWSRPLGTDGSRRPLAELLLALRRGGVVVPLLVDEAPWPEVEPC